MQTGVDLFDQARFGFSPNLLLAPLLQALDLEGQSRILAVDSAQDLPVVQRIAIRSLFLVQVCPGDDGVDQVALVLHQPQGAFEMRFSGMEIERLAQNVHALVQIRFSFYVAVDGSNERRELLALLLLDVVLESLENGIAG